MHPEDLRNFFADDLRDQDEETLYGQQVRKCIDQADVLIDNSDRINLGDYKRKVQEFARLAIGAKLRPPSRTEIYMNMAYSACHSSRCLKRHVGAVVVDQGGTRLVLDITTIYEILNHARLSIAVIALKIGTSGSS
jgi:hypothetical protein